MANLLEKGSKWLEQMRSKYCSSPVTYVRDDLSKQVLASFGKTEVEMASESGLAIKSSVIDFLILADELGFTPEAGDVILAGGRKHEVMNLGSEGAWRWSDSYGTTLRIHTKDIGAAI